MGVGFNPELTARENIFLGGAILGLTRKGIESNFDKIVEFSELEEFLDMKFKNFSSGMQVRLAFALAIYAHAEILLMDEVLAVGDSNFQNKCLQEFNNYKAEGKTVVLVTHDIAVVQRYCDRALLLRNGRISRIGKSEDICNEYILQNMSDEEMRLNQQEDTSIDQKNIHRQVRISGVKILDEDSSEKHVFKTGKPMNIAVQIENESEQKIDLGGCIVTNDGHYLAGFSTKGESMSVGRGTNHFIYRIDALPFLSGNYYINIALFDYGTFAIIDLLEKSKGSSKSFLILKIKMAYSC